MITKAGKITIENGKITVSDFSFDLSDGKTVLENIAEYIADVMSKSAKNIDIAPEKV